MVEIEKIKDNFAKLAAIDSPSLKERNMADIYTRTAISVET